MKRGASVSRGPRRTYFFLSYAHVPPNQELTRGDERDSEPDYWVKVFFDELHGAVKRFARPDSGLDIGFYDPQLPPGSDWKALLAAELGAAEVFVPLYSPRYLTWSWPRTERESFQGRLAATGAEHADRHIQPVLWTPIPWTDESSAADREMALSLGEGLPDYAENGLCALRMLTPYHDQYYEIVDRLARRIVDVAELTPMGASAVPVLQAYRSEIPVGMETPFVVAVLAPTAAERPAGRAGTTYGRTAAQWRPFLSGGTVPVAEYAANLAERLGLPAKIVAFGAGDPPFASAPGLLLVDPWIAADESGRARLAEAIAALPDWVVTVVVIDPDDPDAARGGELTETVNGMLPNADPPRVRDARGPQEFEQLVPFLVTQTRGRYLVRAKVYPPSGPATERPHLGGLRQRNQEGDS
jgi:FxsC-like protein